MRRFLAIPTTHKAAALVEYVVLMGLLAVVVIFSVVQLGAGINTVFSDNSTTVQTNIEDNTGIRFSTPDGGGGGGDPTFINPDFYSISEIIWSPDPTDPFDSLRYTDVPPGVTNVDAYATYWTSQATWSITSSGGNLAGFPTFTLNPVDAVLTFDTGIGWPQWCASPSWTPSTPPADAFVTIQGADSDGNIREIVYTLRHQNIIC